MSQNTGVARTRVVAIIFVNTKLETFGVNIISYSFDSTWKSGSIWLEVASPDNKTLKHVLQCYNVQPSSVELSPQCKRSELNIKEGQAGGRFSQ